MCNGLVLATKSFGKTIFAGFLQITFVNLHVRVSGDKNIIEMMSAASRLGLLYLYKVQDHINLYYFNL